MEEPKRIPLTDSPKNKEPKKIRLLADDDDILDDIQENENNKQNNTTSISELESDKID